MSGIEERIRRDRPPPGMKGIAVFSASLCRNWETGEVYKGIGKVVRAANGPGVKAGVPGGMI
jgi:hypothetical protein